MHKSHVEVVLINWKRPANVALIIDALRSQSVPCTITVCDCHQEPQFALSGQATGSVDRLYSWKHNLGAYSRYVPCAGYDHEFTYLADDDMLPGARCLEHFLDHACARRFGVLGQIGRRLKPDGIYRNAPIARTRWMEEVDMVVRAYFVRTKNLMALPTMRWDLGLQGSTDSEDDIILAVAMQLKLQLGCYLTPVAQDGETAVDFEGLPAPYSLSARGDHLARRTELLRRAETMGWMPYERRGGSRLLSKVRRLVS